MLDLNKIKLVLVNASLFVPAVGTIIYSAGWMAINIVCVLVLFLLGKKLISPFVKPVKP